MRAALVVDGFVFVSALAAQSAVQDMFVKVVVILVPTAIAVIGNIVLVVTKKYVLRAIVEQVVQEVYKVERLQELKAAGSKPRKRGQRGNKS